MQLNIKSKDLRAAQSALHSFEKDFNALDASYKCLAQSHDLLVLELVRQLAYLRTYTGKTLEPQALSQIVAQFARCLPAEEVFPLFCCSS